ncbi:MAG: phosphoribosylformylglycinamidine synthase subunit PurQ [Myxococcales bacterium]|nr:phosphoribosylformylglycinamidine synthase subunit PurQ [Myxococcales bacterium]MCB9575772.1 phosphoribosylformylglycinamidine synthase subunit PurQ [Polyangiaceae bacterium]
MSRIDAFRALPESEQAELKKRVKVLVLTGLGLNCEAETEAAFRMAGATPERVHLLDLLDTGGPKLRDFQVLAFVGGFAFGDHLGAGFVFANKIRYRLYDDLVRFIEDGGFSLGICNGFQTMTRLGLLPGLDGSYRTPLATLAPNDRPGYRDAWVRLAFDAESPCLWTRGVESMDLPTRHGEGKFIAKSGILERLEGEHLVAARYVDETGAATEQWPDNPNGSPKAVAGICDPSGRLFGLMPHPDAFLYPFQHPQWARRRAVGEVPARGDGMKIFESGVTAAAALAR